MLDRIYASKLFQSSSRQDEIRAAIQNPINVELVVQLEEYLDDEYRQQHVEDDEKVEEVKEVEDVDTTEESEASQSNSESAHEDDEDEENNPLPKGSTMFKMPTSEDELNELAAKFEGTDSSLGGPDTSDYSDEDLGTPLTEEDINESTHIQSLLKPIVGCTLDKPTLDVMKDTLNLQQDTFGVSRVQLKDTEVWIYYDDEVNLNNVMTEVIERLLDQGYQLEFNRLARSENAIVFESSVSKQ